jgi:hypothetical protein
VHTLESRRDSDLTPIALERVATLGLHVFAVFCREGRDVKVERSADRSRPLLD